jgi:hypothetical protein
MAPINTLRNTLKLDERRFSSDTLLDTNQPFHASAPSFNVIRNFNADQKPAP